MVVGVILIAVLTADRFLLRRALRSAVRKFQRVPVLGDMVQDEMKVAEWLDRSVGLLMTGIALLVSLAIANVDIGPITRWLLNAGVAVRDWLAGPGVRIAIILVFGYLSWRVIHTLAQPFIRSAITRNKSGIALDEASKRSKALSQVTGHAIAITMFTVVAFMVLAEIGVSIAPLLAGVSVVGIAVGFGAQNTVRDVIAGAFIIGENQFRVGDVAAVGGKTGLVEGLNLRRTTLRDLDGVVHYIPNGEITVASNYTKEFSRVNLDISVAYKEDLDRVIRVLNRVGAELSQDSYFGPLIIEAPRAIRVNNFGDSGIDVKVLGVTQPIRQWEVMGELRRRIKRAFDDIGIEIPFPHRTIYWGEGAHPSAPSGVVSEASPLRVETDESPESNALGIDPFVAGFSAQSKVDQGLGKDLLLRLDAVRPLFQQRKFGLLLDIDGTLARINPNPAAVSITPAVRQMMDRIARKVSLVVLTGRSVSDARRIIGLNALTYVGNHGVQWWQKGHESVLPEAEHYVRYVRDVAVQANRRLGRVAGVIVEDKGPSLAIHYRAALDPASAVEAIEEFLARTREAGELERRDGKMVIELRAPINVNKGTALTRFAAEQGLESLMVLGDDFTDMDSFTAARSFAADEGRFAATVAVETLGTPLELTTAADYTLENTDAVEEFLVWLAGEL